MALIKQSTTYTRMFLLVSSTDHLTGLTGASPTVNISKAGGSFAAAGGTVTEVANGWYKIALTSTDTNTIGELAFHITSSGDPTDFVDQVDGYIARGVCTTGGSTTSVPTSAMAPGGSGIVVSQFVGRTLLFDSDTITASLRGQATNITANTSGATPTFTVSALTTAPSSGDTFSVV